MANATKDKSTTDKIKDTVDDAKEKAKDSVESARDKVKETAENVKDTLADATDAAKDKASEMGETITNKAKSTADAVGEKAEDATQATGSGMRSAAQSVREHGPRSGVMGKASSGLADALESTGEYLESEGLSGMGEDLTNMIRRNPLPAVLVGVGLGFILGRALRS